MRRRREMRKKCFLVWVMVVMGILSIAFCQSSSAETKPAYPTRPIIAVVGFAAGGPTDVIARGYLPILQEILGVPITVTNMPGAASAVAAQHVLSQPKDGYTIFFASEILSTWQTMGTVDLHPTRDFTPIRVVALATPVLAVPPNSQFNTVQEFIEYAINNPGKLRIGTAGPATVPHISGLLLERKLGCKFTYVPFQGGGPAITAVMGGHVDATIEMVQAMVQAYQGNQLKILASFTNDPIPGFEKIPPIGKIYTAELSSQLPYGPYFGPIVAKGTPKEIVDILVNATEKASKDPRWLQFCKNMLLTPVDYSGEEAIKFLDQWTAKAAWLLYDTGVAKNNPADFGISKPEGL